MIFDAMSSQKRITSFFPRPDSSKRKLSETDYELPAEFIPKGMICDAMSPKKRRTSLFSVIDSFEKELSETDYELPAKFIKKGRIFDAMSPQRRRTSFFPEPDFLEKELSETDFELPAEFIRKGRIFDAMSPQRRRTSQRRRRRQRRKELSETDYEVPREFIKKVTVEPIVTETVSFHLIAEEKNLTNQNHRLDYAVGKTWLTALKKEFKADYFKKLSDSVLREKLKYTIYPPTSDIFSWTTSVKITDVKVVILGQDPYIRPAQAHGLAFSVRKGVDIPKSLMNIYNELIKDISGFVRPTHGCLDGWAQQGVLLLNTCLTVRAGQSDSHRKLGWELFTDAVIKWINGNLKNVVFMLWGNNAKAKGQLITKDQHLVLTASHPSPLSASRGFFGCRHFSKANHYLQEHGRQGIDWSYLP